MLWGCFSWNGVGSLVQTEGTMNADKYIETINENLEEAVLKLGLEEFILQQDNDPKHTAKKTNKFFEDSHIKLLEWPVLKSGLESN